MDTRRNLQSALILLSLVGLSAIALADRPTMLRSSDRAGSFGAEQLASPGSGWIHEGCWSSTQFGQCYDIYRDPSGNYWKCGACGTTKNPGPNKCNPISSQTLNSGYWCS